MRKQSRLKIYLISIDDVPSVHISNSRKIAEYLKSKFSFRKYKTKIVKDFATLDCILKGKENNIAIVNCHDETFPMSEKWGEDWPGYFAKIGERVNRDGCLVVSLTGYPFFYYGRDNKYIEILPVKKKNGLGFFLSPVGGQVGGPHFFRCDITSEGRSAMFLVQDYRPPEILWMTRCIFWINLRPFKIFYGAGPVCGAGAVRIGKGLFVYNALWPLDYGTSISDYSDIILARMSFGFLCQTIEDTMSREHEEHLTSTLDSICNTISIELPKKFKKPPRNESQIQKELERVLTNKFPDLNIRKEKNCFPYSIKSYKPDFVSTIIDLVIEVKLCTPNRDPATIVKEINDYIIAFKTRYRNQIFVLYDAGNRIINTHEFSSDFEKYNQNVRVLVIKK